MPTQAHATGEPMITALAAELAPPLLTIAEQNAIDQAAKLWNSLVGIVGHGPTRESDLGELCAHIHAIQHAVMAQAAARAYPNDYRLAGSTVGDPS